MTEQRAALDRAIDDWNAVDLSLLDLYAPFISTVLGQPWARPGQGFYEAIFGSLSDIELENPDFIEQGNQLGCRFTMHATHTGELAGIAATGRRVHQSGFTIVRFEGVQIVERHSLADFDSVMAQVTAP